MLFMFVACAIVFACVCVCIPPHYTPRPGPLRGSALEERRGSDGGDVGDCFRIDRD